MKINLFQKIFLRIVKNIEIYGLNNLTLAKSTILNNRTVINARMGTIYLGEKVRIGQNSELVSASNKRIEIKDFSTMYSNCKIIGEVVIERNCVLASNIYISSGNHIAFEIPEIIIRLQDQIFTSRGKDSSKKVHIHEDVWIGNGVFIAQGITIGRGAIVGAGAVVTKNIHPYEVVVGNPGKVLKKRLLFEPPSCIDFANQNHWPYFYQGFNQRALVLENETRGFPLIDDGIIYLRRNSGMVTLEGNSSKKGKIEVSINESVHVQDISEGRFSIKLSNTENYNDEIFSIHLKGLLPNCKIFIQSVSN